MRNTHGRYLSGLGGPKGAGYDLAYRDNEVLALEVEDDTDGSGIFDQKGRAATSNPDTGVFATHNSLPGYASREVPFTVSRDIRDVTSGAAVVGIPSGGMVNVERYGDMYGAGVMGPTTGGAALRPSAPTGRMQPYANLTGRSFASLYPGAPVTGPPSLRPANIPQQLSPVPSYPGEMPVPFDRPQLSVPTASIVHGGQVPMPVGPAMDPVAAAAPGLPSMRQIPSRSTVNVGATRAIAISGFGADGSSSTSAVKMAVIGLMVGAGAAFIYGAVK